MTKTNSIFTATVASILYFVIFIMLKYYPQNNNMEWQSALSGALVFWFIIYLVHHFLYKEKQSTDRVR
ncbi:MAG TPA: hypothetical protein VIO11_02885 [Candidatus Methanoperedens sp.]